MSSNYSDTPSIGSYISSFYRIGSSFLAHKFDKYDIGFGQYQFLMKLYLEDGLSHEELTQRVFVDKANTTRAVTKLCEGGYVVIQKDEHDKRKYRIFLTDYAKSMKDDIWSIATEWENQLLGCLDDEEIAKLSEIFTKVAEHNKWMNFK
ncbi:MAG: MarR family transcriptional regulator [Oscillospiraceae bacterium]